MQSKHNQPVKSAKSTKNIFSESGSAIARFAAGQRLNFLEKAYRRNSDSYYDESLFGTWGLLLLMSLVTCAGGIYYHYNIFQTAFGLSGIAVGGSFLLYLLAEICLVWFGLNWLRGIYNGVWKQSFPDFGIAIGMAIIVIAAALWDYDINTRAVSTINKNIHEIEIKETPFSPPSSIAVYEEKIRAANATIEQAQTSTWRGKPTGQGLDLQKSNTQLIAQLEQQKSTALSIARAEHDSLQQVQQKLVTGTAHQLADYGRYAVLAKFLFILLIPLFEIKNFEASASNEEDDKQLEPDFHISANLNTAPLATPKIYFRNSETPVPTPPPPAVEKRGKPVATQSRKNFEDVEVGSRPQLPQDQKEDVESDILIIVGKWGKITSRWREAVEKGNKLNTMASNFTAWQKSLIQLLEADEVGITDRTKEKALRCLDQYKNEILPIIQKNNLL